MMKWLQENAAALQALAGIVTMLAAVAALVGVKVQIDANSASQREQSARDIYREYLNLSIARPDLSRPDYCKIAGTDKQPAYDDYVEYLLYTSEQVLEAMPDWQPTMQARLLPHKELLCSDESWTGDVPEVRAMIDRFRAEQCAGFQSACAP